MNTKKRVTLLSTIAGAAILLATSGIYASEKIAYSNSIGETAAVNFAMLDANLSAQDVQETEVEFKREGLNSYAYEVEIETANGHYEYRINAADGTVTFREVEVDEDVVLAEVSVDEKTAYQLALAKAGVSEADVTHVEIELDRENGKNVYDVDFTAGGIEYDVTVDGATGDVLTLTTEPADQPSTPVVTPTETTTITVEEAKRIALANAGLTEGEVTFTEAKLDKDDNVTVYDIQFETATQEFDYEINAATGAIIDKDVEAVETPATTPVAATENYISVDQAKDVALKHAGLNASAVRFTKAKLDHEDNTMVYEIEFIASGVEYEYEINAFTGAVMDADKD